MAPVEGAPPCWSSSLSNTGEPPRASEQTLTSSRAEVVLPDRAMPTEITRTLAPTAVKNVFAAPDGTKHTPPASWAVLPPGDAGLTRRVKAAGPTWTVVEKKGRKTFSHGVWAEAATITAERARLEAERATPAYEKKRAADTQRRERKQVAYVGAFDESVRTFLRFADPWVELEARLAALVTAHATPVGSGTVARTERIPVEKRAEHAVIAWLRHQTTSYDDMTIARVKGARREVRADLAKVSRALLEAHRRPTLHSLASCPLCRAAAPNAPVSS
jgi:hypothetical protein